MFGFSKLYRRWYNRGWRDGEVQAVETARVSRQRVTEFDLSLLIGKPLIVIGNEWCDPTIGFGLEIQHVSTAGVPMLVVRDYVSGQDVLTFGHIRPFTDQLYAAVKKLNPYERWVFVSKNHHAFTDFDKPKSGVASTPEELDAKLTVSGFFTRLEDFRQQNEE